MQSLSPKRPRLLVINPNTTEAVTARIMAMVAEEAGDAVTLSSVTGRFGASYISSRVGEAIAGYVALDAAAIAMQGPTPPDGIVIACFGDPGIGAVRELTGIPVVGFAEAGITEAAAQPGRFVIVTNGDTWCEMLWELVDQYRLTDRVADIASLGAAAQSAEATASFIDELVKETGATRTVLGGAGLIPIIAEVKARLASPVIDPHRTAIARAIAAINAAPARIMIPPAKVTYSGLTPALASLLAPEAAVAPPQAAVA